MNTVVENYKQELAEQQQDRERHVGGEEQLDFRQDLIANNRLDFRDELIAENDALEESKVQQDLLVG